MSTKRIREELATALEEDSLDVDRILALSTELAKQDEEFVRFSTDAAIISRLGRELVARAETAVAELIKNAYDADAKKVTLTFVDADSPGGQLIVEDDGIGMTRDQLVAGFMRLSSNEKVIYPHSPRCGRRRAGRKGIGRFAVQRLGQRLLITTQTLAEPQALSVSIDWNAFVSGRDLASIASRVELVPKQRAEGTTLVISGLREGWTEAAIRRVYRYVAELLQPFPIRSDQPSHDLPNAGVGDVDPGFKVALLRSSGGSTDIIADESTQIFAHALAEIEAYVDAHGIGLWSIKSDKIDLNDTVLPIGKGRDDDEPFNVLRSVGLRAYYYIFDPELIPRSMFATIREMATLRGGIRIYRNGFRVLPYGERGDDWLGLDASTRARAILPPHSNSNFFGFVEVSDPEGVHFEETSSREGLLENAAFEELRDFAGRVLKSAALRVAQARGRKRTAGQENWNKDTREPVDVVQAAVDRLEEVAARAGRNRGTPAESELIAEQITAEATQIAEELQSAVNAQRELSASLLEELGMLRVLASLGLLIGEFTHEIRQTLGAANLNARRLAKDLPAGSSEQQIAADLASNVERIKTYASYFDRAVSDNATRELVPQDVAYVARDFVRTMEPAATRAGIQLQVEISGYDLNTGPMHSSEWASVLFNFYSNAYKAIKRAHVQGKMLIHVGSSDNRVYLEFSDNGDGIPTENRDRIFNPFFTTSTPVSVGASEDEELQGTGLGLKIVKDIAESYRGDVFLVDPPVGYNTCFRIEFPSSGAMEE